MSNNLFLRETGTGEALRSPASPLPSLSLVSSSDLDGRDLEEPMAPFQAKTSPSVLLSLCCRVRPHNGANGKPVLNGASTSWWWPPLAGCAHLPGQPSEQHRGAVLQRPLPQHCPGGAALRGRAHCAGHQLHPLAGERARRVPFLWALQPPRALTATHRGSLCTWLMREQG